MAETEKKKRVCKVCEVSADSLKANQRKCDGCGCVTCRHVATSKGEDDRCPLCTLQARKAEKAAAAKPDPKPKAKPDEEADDEEAAT